MVPVYKGRFSRSANAKPPKLNALTIQQSQMLRIANAGLESIKKRLESGRDENDSPYPPLTRNYNRWKSRALKLPLDSAKRDFKLGVYRGKGPKYLKPKHPEDTLLGNLRVRKVSAVMAEARNSSVVARQTAGGMNKYYQGKGRKGWLLFSPRDLKVLSDTATKVIGTPIPLIFENYVNTYERKTA
jgi:hypothetical protein